MCEMELCVRAGEGAYFSARKAANAESCIKADYTGSNTDTQTFSHS